MAQTDEFDTAHRYVVTLGDDGTLPVTPGYDLATGIGAATNQFVATLAR